MRIFVKIFSFEAIRIFIVIVRINVVSGHWTFIWKADNSDAQIGIAIYFRKKIFSVIFPPAVEDSANLMQVTAICFWRIIRGTILTMYSRKITGRSSLTRLNRKKIWKILEKCTFRQNSNNIDSFFQSINTVSKKVRAHSIFFAYA